MPGTRIRVPFRQLSGGSIFIDHVVSNENRVFGKVVPEGFSGSGITNPGSIRLGTQFVSPEPMNIEILQNQSATPSTQTRAVGSGGPQGRRRPTAKYHYHFNLRNLNRKLKAVVISQKWSVMKIMLSVLCNVSGFRSAILPNIAINKK